MSSKTVLVTGATGFIAQYIVDNLLSKGYSVVGTARSQEKYQPILDAFMTKYPDAKLTFEIVPEISIDKAFDDVLKKHPEITVVLHTASPATFGKTENLKAVFLDPAVNGTLNILKAIEKYAPQITNVVITSSYAAILTGDSSHVHTNESWNPINWDEHVVNDFTAYVASKTYAERAARDFVKEHNVNFTLATVNPPYVLGPQLFDFSVGPVLNTSNQLITDVLKIDKNSTKPEVGTESLAVDVRDVAAFHILPFENEKAANERFFIVGDPVVAQTLLNIINKNFPELKGKVAVGDPASERELLDKHDNKYDLTNLHKVIGEYDFIPVEKSVTDTLKQYLKFNKLE
ncbi:hypothetical protein CANINC_000444 [Pichia inconspicua]|uniref:NAD-dependent epimerase/dehydratase domain-containing protein n=1 Tax=Pichia inconspicua TaxID=52247 RepID=A0A4T0X649_9ASCO|nr:hypothetical protein CANINC_000444 [[Candida] inconspicua]